MKLSPEMSRLLELVERESGLQIDPSKGYLLRQRLGALAKEQGHSDVQAMAVSLMARPYGKLRRQLCEALTTNETLFFRSPALFKELVRSALPPILEARASTKRLRVWSAACSTGQELWSLAILLAESFPELSRWRVEILGSDYNEAVLSRARAGIYSADEVRRGLSREQLSRWFEPCPQGYSVNKQLRRGVSFRSVNLTRNLTGMQPFDLILLRHVIIYFSADTREQLSRRLRPILAPDGLLALGVGESFHGTQKVPGTSFHRFSDKRRRSAA